MYVRNDRRVNISTKKQRWSLQTLTGQRMGPGGGGGGGVTDIVPGTGLTWGLTRAVSDAEAGAEGYETRVIH